MADKNKQGTELVNDDQLVDFDDELNFEALGDPVLPHDESITEQKNQVSAKSKDVGP